MLFKKIGPFETVARNINGTEAVISRLCYIKDLILIKNIVVWFWNYLYASIDILFYIMFYIIYMMKKN